jgi:Anti-sigma factor NepR
MLDRTVQVQIGRMLRDIFADVAAEPVPQRFVELLAALEMKEKRQ